jgi:hypothetical protein
VITEHQHQWDNAELATLVSQAQQDGFLLLAGFEFSTTAGDLLVYGLAPAQAKLFQAGLPPDEAVRRVHELGGVCIAAHVTRTGMGFDERILTLPVEAMEVCSANLRDHEQRLAVSLAEKANIRPIAASDAHTLQDVGRYATEFDDLIRSMADLQWALGHGRFRMAPGLPMRTGAWW